MHNQRLRTGWMDHSNRIIYEVVTEKIKYEPDFIFEIRHKLKVSAKKYFVQMDFKRLENEKE